MGLLLLTAEDCFDQNLRPSEVFQTNQTKLFQKQSISQIQRTILDGITV